MGGWHDGYVSPPPNPRQSNTAVPIIIYIQYYLFGCTTAKYLAICFVFTFEKLQSTCTNRRQAATSPTSPQPQREGEREGIWGKTHRTEPGHNLCFISYFYLIWLLLLFLLCCFMALCSLALFSIELKNSYNPYNSPYARAEQAIKQTYGQNVAQH